MGGHYTLERLCELAEAMDAGFDRAMFARMLGFVDRFDVADFAEYDVEPSEVAALRQRVASWREQLMAEGPGQ